MSLIPIILCGGAGSRLWPVSRELHPKPFIRLADGQSLLHKAFLRGASLPDVDEVFTVTNRELFFKTKDELQEVNTGALKTSFILEPFGRGTAAAAVCAAMAVAASRGDGALVLVLPADHLVADHDAFASAVAQAVQLARGGRLVTFGIQPEGPETGYGYIEASGNDVLRFVEKPSLEVATEYVRAGRYLWNSGMFCFSAGALIAEMGLHCPEILASARATLEHSHSATGASLSHIELNSEAFARVPDQSLDYALMEKSSRVAVVPCAIGWSDIGSWAAMGDLAAADEGGNRLEGEVFLHDVSGCFIRSDARVVGAVGIRNLLVIDTPDALLIADKDRAQDVKRIYAQLKAKGHEAYKIHRTVYRPWGTYTVLEDGPGFKIKRIEVRPGRKLSLQMHHHRSEHWVVVSGDAIVTNGEQRLEVGSNESTFIAAGSKHRLENAGTVDLVMIEVQSGPYLGEDDIVRFDDQYGRTVGAIT